MQKALKVSDRTFWWLWRTFFNSSFLVAVQCISEAYDVDLSDEKQRAEYSIQPATLPSIFDVALKTIDNAKAKVG